MINTSTEYKTHIRQNRKFVPIVNITLADSTELILTATDLMPDGFVIDDSTSPRDNFEVGSAVIGKATIILNNFNNKFSSYNFFGATINPIIGLELSETTESINKGIFTVEDATAPSSSIVLIGYDNIRKFDVPFSDMSVSYPITAQLLLSDICVYCGVTLVTTTFLNDDFNITRDISSDALTCREVIGYIAQISGNYIKADNQGRVVMDWYDLSVLEDFVDGGEFDESTPYATGDSADGGEFDESIPYATGDSADGGGFDNFDNYHHIYSLSESDIYVDDVTITGVEVKALGTEADYGETETYGTSEYLLRIDENPLIIENTAKTISDSIGPKIVGMKFRPLAVSALSDPSIEAGDVGYISTRDGQAYKVFISNTTFKLYSRQYFSCDAENPVKNGVTRYSDGAKIFQQTRTIVDEKLNSYDLAVKQLNSLMAHSFGFYTTEEIQEDGSVIYYSHDKPHLDDSVIIWKQTIDAFAVSTDGGENYNNGFDAEGNAVVNVLSAIGINADWINTGVLRIGVESPNATTSPTFKMYLDTGQMRIVQLSGAVKRLHIGVVDDNEDTAINLSIYDSDGDRLVYLGEQSDEKQYLIFYTKAGVKQTMLGEDKMFFFNANGVHTLYLDSGRLYFRDDNEVVRMQLLKDSIGMKGTNGKFLSFYAEDYLSFFNESEERMSLLGTQKLELYDPTSGVAQMSLTKTSLAFRNTSAKVLMQLISTQLAFLDDDGDSKAIYDDEFAFITDKAGTVYANITKTGIYCSNGSQDSWYDNDDCRIRGDLYVWDNVSADSFTDRTPAFLGNALETIQEIKADENGNINHESLPDFARKKVKRKHRKKIEQNTEKNNKKTRNSKKNKKPIFEVTETIEEGRDIGGMISILIVAVQELVTKNKEQDKEINELKKLLRKKGD